MNKQGQSRRQFLKTASAFTVGGVMAGCATTGQQTATVPKIAVPPRRTIGPGDPIRCGYIGVGGRGSSILQSNLAMAGVEVVAVCDAYDVWRERALGWCREHYPEVTGYIRFEDMLATENLDCVVIATPDHIHGPAILAALEAGKDVYCEKPMTLTWEEARAVRDTAQATGAVFQVGTQLRSMPMYQQVRDIVQSGGIGTLAEVQNNRHGWGGMSDYNVAPVEANEATCHWDVFLRDTPRYDFDARRFFQWRQFKEYSNGVSGDLMLHHLDLCHFITGCGMPTTVMSVGNIAAFHDGRTVPDTMSALIAYPEGFHLNHTTTLVNGEYGLVERYLGSEGTIEIRDMSEMRIIKDGEEEVINAGGIPNEPHLEDYFNAIRSRGQTIAPVEAGFMGAVVCHMAVLSQLSGQSMQWDPDSQSVKM
ncbi:MAG: Gfo/Idh/MocA family oxidoreductase [Candidatus Hydrogenedentes bacterium]|nr:Gfo/Idh/MocA family oxidoreductase [Candidatus Hydrogenedentota bacterium]